MLFSKIFHFSLVKGGLSDEAKITNYNFFDQKCTGDMQNMHLFSLTFQNLFFHFSKLN